MSTFPDDLSRTLHRWRVVPPADPNFGPSVWRRLERRTRESWPSYLRANLAAWMLAAVVAISAAAFTGRAVARSEMRSDRDRMAATYLVGLDPRVQAALPSAKP